MATLAQVLMLAATCAAYGSGVMLFGQSTPGGTKSVTTPQRIAHVTADGTLLGWKGLFLLNSRYTGGTEVLFDCDSPLVNAKAKKAGCVITPRSTAPFVVGADGALQGWHVSVAGSLEFQCADPALSFSEHSISCPQAQADAADSLRAMESENERLRAQLAEAQAELAKLKDSNPSPIPFVIAVVLPTVHAFLCTAPTALDLDKRLLTCAEVKQGF